MGMPLTTTYVGSELVRILGQTILALEKDIDAINGEAQLASKGPPAAPPRITVGHFGTWGNTLDVALDATRGRIDDMIHAARVGQLRSHVNRLDFFMCQINEDEAYTLTLADWAYLNDGNGARWIIEP